jgi:hypothetical protein
MLACYLRGSPGREEIVFSVLSLSVVRLPDVNVICSVKGVPRERNEMLTEVIDVRNIDWHLVYASPVRE